MFSLLQASIALLAVSGTMAALLPGSKTAEETCTPCPSFEACFPGQVINDATEMTQTIKSTYESDFTTGAYVFLETKFVHSDSRRGPPPYMTINNTITYPAYIGITYGNSQSIENGQEAKPVLTAFYKIDANKSCKSLPPRNLLPDNVWSVRYTYPDLIF